MSGDGLGSGDANGETHRSAPSSSDPAVPPSEAESLRRLSAVDRLFKRLETLFEVGASAMVPITTLLFPLLLGALSFLALPYGWQRQHGDTDAGDQGYISIAPYTGEPGDTPEPQPEPDEPSPPSPASKGEPKPDASGDADQPVPNTAPGPVTPDGPGDDEATSPEVRDGQEDGTAEKPVPAGVHVVKGGKVKQCIEVPNPEITRLGEGKFIIERRLIDYYATHLKALDSLGWVEHWKSEDGTEKGFRIGGVKCSNDLYLAGLRSGDIVTRINDSKVGSIPEAIAVYARYRGSDVIRVEYLRHGKTNVHTYRLR